MRHVSAVLLAAVVILVASGEVQATPTGQGGYIYWSKMVGTAGTDLRYEVWRQQVDTAWAAVGSATVVDCVSFSNTNTKAWSAQFYSGKAVEVYDPRDKGGTGKLLVPVIYNDSWGSGTDYTQSWDLVVDDPTTKTKTLLSDGTAFTTSTAAHTVGLMNAVVAPANWVPGTTSNGVSVVTSSYVGGYPSYGSVNYLYDANANGALDNTTSEGKQITSFGGNQICVYDMEFAGNALYTSTMLRTGTDAEKIYRTWEDSTGTTHSDLFYQTSYAVGTQTNPICGTNGRTNGKGLAINTHTAKPVVYYFGYDNTFNGSSYVQYAAIFALRDLNGDNVVSIADGDCVTKIWRSTDYGITLATGGYGVGDVEFYANPQDGSTSLVCTGILSGMSTATTFALGLSDNGLVVTSGTTIVPSYSLGFSGNSSVIGIELDMNPYTVPEPATLALLGFGALGILGRIRRQRVR